ncbi:hypothetical protein OAF83_00695 [Rubripirellula sp.]|jgi:photosystem II stability/assembly factor-like uncharacterized protein|nr:hypothetical protein [Rubripirellula sp.]MDB4749399.1 hypothetical protein [Rubripirellula sp.]
MLKPRYLPLLLLPIFSCVLLTRASGQWASVPLPGNHPEVFALATHGDKGLVIGTGGLPNSQTNATGILWSDDHGDSIKPRSNGVGSTRFDQLFRSLHSSNGLLVAASADGVYFSENDCETWEKRSSGLPVIPQTGKKSSNALTSLKSTIFCGTPSGVFKTDDLGKSWSNCSSGLNNPDVRALATLDGLIFASTDGDGVYCSSDDGNSWSAANTGMPPGARSRALIAHEGVLFAGTPYGTFRSTDKGVSWTATVGTANARSFAAGKEMVALGAFRGSGSVYVSIDKGEHWKDVSANLPRGGIGVWAMAMDNQYLYAAINRQGMWRIKLDELKKIKTVTSPIQSDMTGVTKLLSSHPLMLALDPDRDGEISAKEIQNAKITLKSLDKNKDGKISESEMGRTEKQSQAIGNPIAGRLNGPTAALARLRSLDSNGDGKVTRDEIPIRMQRILDRADSNGDDVLNMQEIEKFGETLGRGRPN